MKKILFLNTTKLAVALKRTLMVLTLCIISALYIQAEESTIEPSDSIAVTGPKKSHWTTKGTWRTTYYNVTDYARVEATIEVYDEEGHIVVTEVGSVVISYTKQNDGTDIESSSLLSSTTTAFVNWNSGAPHDGILNDKDNNIKAKHTLNVTLTINDKENDDYVFEKWEKKIESVDTPLAPSINPKNTTINDNVVIGGGGPGFTEYGNAQNNTYENTGNRYTVTYIAKFVPRQTECKVTFEKARGGGEYTYYKNGDGTDTIATGQVVTLNGTTATTLTALTSEDYKFWAWYVSYDGGTTYDTLSTTTPYTHTFEKDATVYAKFIPKDAALFIIKGGDGTEYWNLNEACEKAPSFSNVVLPKANGTLYPLVDGELYTSIPAGKTITPYTIPSGVTLLVPYDDKYTLKTSEPEVVAPASASNCKPYITLTLAENVTIDVNGEICVMTKQYATNTTYTNNGVRTYYGFIYTNKGSSITLNNGANLYCWGYISGDGRITANEGAKVYEMFQITDFRGGTRSTQDDFKTYKIFICQSYYMQNIETELICNSNSYLYAHYAFILSLGSSSIYPKGSACVVGPTNAMFTLQDNGKLYRKYDRQTDRMHYILEKGTCTINNVSLTVSFATINSKDYVLPINSNMTIDIKSGCNFILTQDMSILPNANINIDEGAKVTINSGCNLYIYDTNEWIGKGCIYNNTDIKQLAFVGWNEKNTWGKPKERYINLDAKLKVNGELILNGSLYTTAAGADICSDGTGQIIFNSDAGTKNETYQDKNNNTYQSIPITAAQLHNGSEFYNSYPNLEYLPTISALANTTITYANHHWGWLKVWKDWNGDILKICNTWTETLPTVKAPTNPTRDCYTFKEWSISRDDSKQEIVYTATYTQNTYPITYHAGVNGTGTIESGTKNCGEDFTLSTNTFTRFGYIQTGWATTDGGEKKYELGDTYAENAPLTLYPYWVKNEPLDIVDADGTYLTINANGWASSGWPYTINGTPYEKTARKADRTLTVPYTGDTNDDMAIVVTKTGGEIVSSHIYKVPFVYDSNTEMSSTDENSIVFVKSGTLTVGTASAKEIYVAPGAELKVNGTLTVGKLVLRTTPYKAAILTNNGTINGQVYYSRISPNSEQYYQFGLPLSCDLASVQMSNTGKLGGSQPKYGTAWMLKSYSESLRAQNGISKEGANWNLLPSDGTITAGVGYEMFSNSNYYREFYFPVDLSKAKTQVSVQYTEGTKGEEHNGWNIITSPLTSRANVPIIDPASAFKVCWLDSTGSYRQKQDTVIPPAIPFSIQASAEGELNFAVPTIAAAPRKQSAAEALTETEWVHLDIFDAYGEGDETSLFVHPTRFEQTYKIGIDVAKQSLTASRAILYSTHAYGYMAFAGVADTLLETGIDLVVYSPSAQELTFSLRENKFLNRLEYLWLIDNKTGGRTDLLLNNYTFLAAAGTAKGRFVLNGRFKAPQISTGIGNTQTDYNIYAIGNNIAISGVEQGTPIYVFDAVGHMIYTTAATSDEVIVPAPCAGVYMLSVGGQTAKLVINK